MGTSERGAVIVTGAGRGIGAACATLIARSGHPVIVNYASASAPATAVVDCILRMGGRAAAIQADVGVEEDVSRLFDEAEHTFGAIYGLVNNAGITGHFGRLDTLATEALFDVLRVNVAGAIMCCREAVKRMSTARGGKGGSIVNISSLAARTGGAGEWVHYAATKGAVDTLTIGLAREVATEGIRVNAVAPGLIDTDLHATSGAPDRLFRLSGTIPMMRAGTAHEVAEGVLWLLSAAASYTTGSILEIGGGR